MPGSAASLVFLFFQGHQLRRLQLERSPLGDLSELNLWGPLASCPFGRAVWNASQEPMWCQLFVECGWGQLCNEPPLRTWTMSISTEWALYPQVFTSAYVCFLRLLIFGKWWLPMNEGFSQIGAVLFPWCEVLGLPVTL